MSKSEQLLQQEGRCGVGGEMCFHSPLDTANFFIDVIFVDRSFVGRNSRSTKITRTDTNKNRQ